MASVVGIVLCARYTTCWYRMVMKVASEKVTTASALTTSFAISIRPLSVTVILSDPS